MSYVTFLTFSLLNVRYALSFNPESAAFNSLLKSLLESNMFMKYSSNLTVPSTEVSGKE